MSATKVGRLQPGQIFRIISINGERGQWHTLARKDAAKAAGYVVLTYTDGKTYACHNSCTVEVQS